MHLCFVEKNKKVKKNWLKAARSIKDLIGPLDTEDPSLDLNFMDLANLDRI